MRKRKLVKVMAVFLAIQTIYASLLPTLTYGLTSGPTAPEATSFEPVDTTDMVNLLTGDFTYNIPLLEVPGPGGGYPVNLSYHAGIQPNEDASWVGLGWTLNPGAINRTVNGYADDHKDVNNVDRVFWEGGETQTHTVGLSVGIANAATVSAGLSFSNDTYRGFCVGGYMGLGIGYGGANSPLRVGANMQIGISPYGNHYSSTGLGVGIGTAQQTGIGLGASVGLSINSAGKLSAGASGGINFGGNSIMGASIRTGGTKPALSTAGFQSKIHNNKAGNISTTSNSWSVDIPVYAGINIRLGQDYQRYWIDESASVATNGSLYYPNDEKYSKYFDDHAFDTYDLLDTDLNIVRYSDAVKVIGGSFPDYDRFAVTAQGLGGNIRPFHYRRVLDRQNKRDESKEINKELVRNYSFKPIDQPVEFRFVNDFSNRFEYEPRQFGSNSSDPLTYYFDVDVLTGDDGNSGYGNNQLAGSKRVKWYTNQEIVISKARNEGFIDTKATGFTRNDNSQIGGFMITNESGVTYHYSLPAYSYDEFMKSENTEEYKEKEGDIFNTLTKAERYAYTWLLTAVTGPDFVDRNDNGFVDQGDFGYWVEFDYGKWTDSYQWRNPGLGFNKDIDAQFQNYSSGKKEIYYLDAIRTASHTALFIKRLRRDGKGVSNPKMGKFDPYQSTSGKWHFPVSVLGLQKILLLKNESIQSVGYDNIKANGNNYTYPMEYSYEFEECEPCDNQPRECCRTIIQDETVMIGHFGQNVIDITDFSEADSFSSSGLRGINFETDYFLCPNSSNSITNEKLYNIEPEIEKNGKYTLQALHFLGKSGSTILPPTSFEYAKNPDFDKNAYDMWGFYKSDYPIESKRLNESIDRLTTNASAENVDAWALTKIKSPLGASIGIEYESDTYKNVELAKQDILRIKDAIDLGDNKIKIMLFENVDLDYFYKKNDNINVLLEGTYDYTINRNAKCDCSLTEEAEDGGYGNISKSHGIPFSSNNAIIKNIDNHEKSITIEDQDFYHELYLAPKTWKERAVNTGIWDCDQPFIPCTFQASVSRPSYISGGVISNSYSVPKPGGGLRVKSISIHSPTHKNHLKTLYEYSNGSTSYEPFRILPPLLNPEFIKSIWEKDVYLAKNSIKEIILENYENTIGISREIPGPGVMYEKVTVREQVIDNEVYRLPNFTEYTFELFRKGMVDTDSKIIQTELVDNTFKQLPYKAIKKGKVVLKDYSSRVGNLKGVTLYDSRTKKPISGTKYNYLHDGFSTFQDNIEGYEPALEEKFNSQGVLEETFVNARFALFEGGISDPYIREDAEYYYNHIKDEYHLLGVISKRETFPSIQTGQTNINYKTGVTTTTQNLAFDFYSGEVTKTLFSDSYDNFYISEKVPAYKKYPAMGLAIYGGKNMLTQIALSKSYKVTSESDQTPGGLVAASVQTWSDKVKVLDEETQPGIWRKQAAYQWDGRKILNTDGTYPFNDFQNNPFDFTYTDKNPSWLNTGAITMYDVHSHALEALDINGNYASSRMDPANTKKIASTTNASYYEAACSGAEYIAGNTAKVGGVSRGEGFASIARSHTGDYSLQVAFNSEGFNYTLNKEKADLDKKYKASVWVYLPGESETAEQIKDVQLFYRVNGNEFEVHPELQERKSKSWYLLELIIDPKGADQVYIGCRNLTSRNVYFDDFRVFPLSAAMTGYVYDQSTGELTYILDHNNFYTHFEYDAAGRLVRTSRELLNFDYGEGKESFRQDHIVSEVEYNYSQNSSN